MTRKIPGGVAAAAAVMIVTFAVTGWPPIGGGIEGDIAQAEGYQTPQLNDRLVQFDDGKAADVIESFDRACDVHDARAVAIVLDHRQDRHTGVFVNCSGITGSHATAPVPLTVAVPALSAFNALMAAMNADQGRAYFNVHTDQFTGGEIRGNSTDSYRELGSELPTTLKQEAPGALS